MSKEKLRIGYSRLTGSWYYTGGRTKVDITEEIEAVLEDKNKQISDLEAKLAESERVAENNKKVAELVSAEHNAKIENLEKQLAEKEKEIEGLKASSDKNIDYLVEFASLIENEKDCNRMLKALSRVREGKKYIVDKEHQDKMSFAVEQLEKVKEKFGYKYNSQLMVSSKSLCNYIDNQIKQLKEKNNG